MIKRKLLKLQLIWAKNIQSKHYMKIYNKYLRACGVDIVGNIKYIHPSSYIDVGYARNIHICENCVLSLNTAVLAHDYSLECGMESLGQGDLNNEKKIVKDVYIGRNVFVGAGSIILPGTHIGDNCIIGAGTVCSGIIPNDSVIVGAKWKIADNTLEWTRRKIRNTITIE